MPALTNPLQKLAVILIALSIVTGFLSSLKDGLGIIQHQQTALLTQIIHQQRDALVNLIGQVVDLLVREEQNPIG